MAYRNGFLTGVPGVLNNTATPYVSAISYQPSGLVAEVDHVNGTKELWAPDPSGMARPCSISVFTPGNIANNTLTDPCSNTSVNSTSGQYLYDGAGNVKNIGSKQYAYDLVSRLVRAANGNAGAETFTYDAFGNITSHGANPQSVNPWTNHLSVNASYDAAGNLVTWTDPNVTLPRTTHYTWDSLGMLTRLSDTAQIPRLAGSNGTRDNLFFYTADDEPVATPHLPVGDFFANRYKSIDFTFPGSGNSLLSRYTWEANSTANFQLNWKEDDIWRGALLLATETPTSTLHAALDHLGSRTLATTSSTIAAQPLFSPFGLGGTTGIGVSQFTGHERDFADGPGDSLDYMHARYYSATLGRFLSVDPVLDQKLALANPQAWNRYSYALEDPLRYIDPDGRFINLVFMRDALAATDAYIKEQAHLPAATRLPNWLLWSVLLNIGSGSPIYGPTPQINAAGINFIKGHEGFFENLYLDTGGHCTIGYGHLVNLGACGATAQSTFADGITEEQGEELLSADVIKDTLPALKLVTTSLSQGQVNAASALSFNIGPGAFGKSSILDALNNTT